MTPREDNILRPKVHAKLKGNPIIEGFFPLGKSCSTGEKDFSQGTWEKRFKSEQKSEWDLVELGC